MKILVGLLSLIALPVMAQTVVQYEDGSQVEVPEGFKVVIIDEDTDTDYLQVVKPVRQHKVEDPNAPTIGGGYTKPEPECDPNALVLGPGGC